MKTQGKQQGFECKLALDQKERMTKKRSKGPTKVRDFVSLIGIIGCNQFPTFPAQGAPMIGDMQTYTTSHNPYVCMEALIADSLATTTTKKRTKRNFFATGFIEGLNAQVEKMTKSVMEMVDAQARMKEELEKEKELRLAAEKQVAELTKQAKVDMTTIAGLVEKSREASNLTLGQERSSISPTKHPSTSNFGN
ncbi:hypothetical protein RHGRI_011538 [Rhododendron griersonianum]|uniref:Uncharacterized protein n=1 Tax=Rhododendron griersonianum TaxID=479676 RepID=A0AAV6KN83_9ERIC|nr:hypothetical protein RHGRI_011538 [Rhododendron griersonianum]